MKIYLAGKITGLDFGAALENFRQAERYVEGFGHEPLNPLKLVDQRIERPYEDMLVDALRIVLERADAIFVLANWRDSLGARIEHAIAIEKGLPIFYQGSVLRDAE